MEVKFFVFIWFLVLVGVTSPAANGYFSETLISHSPATVKKTHLHFFLHDTLSGDNPSAVLAAKPNGTAVSDGDPTPFGSVYVFDDPLTEGPDPDSNVIGNARGFYASTSRGKDMTLLLNADFGFTSGEFNGSSFSVNSRNPITERRREVAVVGGRGKFRMARGFALIKTHFLNFKNGDAVLEYRVTVFHH